MKKTHSDDSSFPWKFASGLTKREYFAAMAMQGLLARNETGTVEQFTAIAVTAADALIEALNKEEKI